MSKGYVKLPNQGNIYSNLMLLYEIFNSDGYADENGYYTKRAIAEIAVNSGLVTSGGKMGKDIEKFVSDTETDETLNSVLQNIKARMQLLRILGLVATDYNSEIYAITDLGAKLMMSVFPNNPDDIPSYKLLMESFMGISTSSEVYDYYCNIDFDCHLGYEVCYALASLNYQVGTDEMPIITTYSIEDISDCISEIQKYRAANASIPNTHPHYPKRQNGSPLKQVSNITRTINQILRLCGIIEPKDKRINGKNYYVCTAKGKSYVDTIKKQMDKKKIVLWSAQSFRKQGLHEQKRICVYGYGNMLSKAGFADVTVNNKDIFSPYQLIPEIATDWFLGNEIRKPPVIVGESAVSIGGAVALSDLRLIPKILSDDEYEEYIKTHISTGNIVEEILRAKDCGVDKHILEIELLERHKADGKEQVYPFVHSLLNAAGLDCKGEIGRIDAYSMYDGHIIPAEIKSYAESNTGYNMKGMRQALENKICTYTCPADLDYASLVIGHVHPTSTAEFREFIDAAFDQWGIKIIAIDLLSIIHMCTLTIWDKKEIDFNDLLTQKGIVSIGAGD